MATKSYMMFQVFCLISVFCLNTALQCKVCTKEDSNCVIGDNIESRTCGNGEDLCFTWFDRKGIEVRVERDCISSGTKGYKAMKKVIGSRNSGCIKNINRLDCFAFCSLDDCN
ncbi:unnamed protein product [Adineta ricciae]|uniref:Uncharacterized protein n=1 Tax=Adineta ricciae TaxID=249248 RepID=A0A816BHJ1_ADIRI|nr:unnamed protein product [Adineta ricciae]CAF1610914.1 unnamed protein product [Adineta ricciae]